MKLFLQKIYRLFILSCLTFFASSSFATTTIDVLVVYTKGAANLYGGDPSTRINQLFQITNQIYADSGVDVQIRVSDTMEVDYTDDNSGETALNNITFNQHAAFNGVAAARERAKADMVIFYRPFMKSHGTCGVAWVGGKGTNGVINANHKPYMSAHVAINSCGDYVTAHELGHNMGLKHSRKQDGVGGTFHYALGYGVVNSFATIMAYQTDYNVDYWSGKVYKFSNPDITTCKNQPCGVDRSNTSEGADARYALNITAPQIANFYVASSASNSSKANSSAASSSAAINKIDLAALAAEVESTRAAYQGAITNVNTNKMVLAEKTTLEMAARTQLAKTIQQLTSATSAYETAMANYRPLAAKLNSSMQEFKTASTAYSRATTATRAAALAAYNSASLKYKELTQQTTAAQNMVTLAKQKLIPATAAVTKETATFKTGVNATQYEKAKTANLADVAALAMAKYKEALTKYETARQMSGD